MTASRGQQGRAGQQLHQDPGNISFLYFDTVNSPVIIFLSVRRILNAMVEVVG